MKNNERYIVDRDSSFQYLYSCILFDFWYGYFVCDTGYCNLTYAYCRYHFVLIFKEIEMRSMRKSIHAWDLESWERFKRLKRLKRLRLFKCLELFKR